MKQKFNLLKIVMLFMTILFSTEVDGQTPVTYTSNPTNAQIMDVFAEAPNIIVTGVL